MIATLRIASRRLRGLIKQNAELAKEKCPNTANRCTGKGVRTIKAKDFFFWTDTAERAKVAEETL